MAFGKKPGPPRPEARQAQPPGPMMSETNLKALEGLDLPRKPQAAPETIAQRLLPAEMFDPNTQGGRLLAALGFSPDDESNVVKTLEALRETAEKDRHVMLAFIGQLNADLPDGVNVQPYFMIPEQCWDGPCGDFLASYLGLTPYGPWNVLPLPKDPRSGEALGIRSHPGAPPTTFVQSVEGVLMKLESEVKAAGDAFRKAIETKAKPDWDGMADIVNLMRKKVRGVAFAITAKTMGEETLKRPRQMFYNETF